MTKSNLIVCAYVFQQRIKLLSSDISLEETLVLKMLRGVLDPLITHLHPTILGSLDLKTLVEKDFGLKTVIDKLQEDIYDPG